MKYSLLLLYLHRTFKKYSSTKYFLLWVVVYIFHIVFFIFFLGAAWFNATKEMKFLLYNWNSEKWHVILKKKNIFQMKRSKIHNSLSFGSDTYVFWRIVSYTLTQITFLFYVLFSYFNQRQRCFCWLASIFHKWVFSFSRIIEIHPVIKTFQNFI